MLILKSASFWYLMVLIVQAEFKPLVQLEEVDVATGEEDEDALCDMWVHM
jgi:hypothetical protein